MDTSKRARRSCKHVMYIQLFSFIFHLALHCLISGFAANAEKRLLMRKLMMFSCIKSSITACVLHIVNVEIKTRRVVFGEMGSGDGYECGEKTFAF